MTVFVGPSNTGKSYLAILIYTLHSFFSVRSLGPGFFQTSRRRSIFGLRARPHDDAPVSDNDVEELTDWLDEMSGRVGKLRLIEDRSEDTPIMLPELVAELVRPRLKEIDSLHGLFDNEIMRCFGVDNASSLVRHQARESTRVSVKRPIPNGLRPPEAVRYDFEFNGSQVNLTAHIPSATHLRSLVDDDPRRAVTDALGRLGYMPRESDDEGRRNLVGLITRTLADLLGPQIVMPLSRAAYYLPADRTGVMHSHRVVVGSLINQASRAGFRRDTPLPQLSGVLADFLEQLIELGDQRREIERRRDLARDIEERILHGGVRMEKSPVGYPEFFYRPEGWKDDLPLINTSSMVSELAPVVLYLRFVVQPGDVLIIEEPESHLHPAMQVRFIRHLVAAVRAGVRVMITTHSEWVLDELANLVRVSQVPEAHRNGIDGADFSLAPEQLGVWLFEPKQRPKGSVVREIPFDEDFGGFRSGFDDVAMNTYNDYAEISNRIEGVQY